MGKVWDKVEIRNRKVCWKRRTCLLTFLLILVLELFTQIESRAAVYENPETGYCVLLEDDADLLTDQEESELSVQMQGITVYGNVAFKSIADNSGTTQAYITDYYSKHFGSGSGTVFLIDMDNRNIWIHSNGAIDRIITKSYADTITDNVYTFASDAEYYLCASKVFEQELDLLEGQKISQPMKYASNVLLAIVMALLINYFVVKIFSRTKKPSESELLGGMFFKQDLKNFNAEYLSTSRVYSPQSSGSGGGSGGGGGSSGGGGGHSF